MNILVTGGLGFIGHHVVSKLQQQGHIVGIIDNRTNYGLIPYNEVDYLMDERSNKFTRQNLYIYNDDISDAYRVNQIFSVEEPEIVIHMASFPRQKAVNGNPAYASRIMSEGLLNLLEASKRYEVRKFVYISSSMVYGDFTDNVTEDAICNPQGQYGIMKLAGEWLTKDYARQDNMVYTILRPSAVYGPLDVEDRVVSKFLLNAMRGQTLRVNGSDEKLDFTYVEDTADGIVGATLSDNTENKIYNITRSKGVSLLDAAQLSLKIVGGGNLVVTDRDLNFPTRGSLNINRAKNDFGFNPQVDVEEGFQRYYDWLSNSTFWSKKTV